VKLRTAILGLLGLCVLLSASISSATGPLDWPQITRECRPWAYHWWLGSAVDKENLARELQRYREGGLGGVHIVPIYGAKGAESRYLSYLSAPWMEMLQFAVTEGARHDLGVDMTTGTGWCFGGPQVSRENSCVRAKTTVVDFPNDDAAAWTVKRDGQELLAAAAVGPEGQSVDVTAKVSRDGRVDWRAPGPGWKLVLLQASYGTCRVKRAAPGGEGFMSNPLSRAAMAAYLEPFVQAFAPPGAPKPRAMYHDSFEYQVNWSPDLLDEFAQRRGYRLQDQLPALAGLGDEDVAARVKADYRETVSDMIVERAFPLWFEWCRRGGMLTRNQAHGAPANLLDLYAMADIPETEMFGHGGPDPRMSKFDEHFGKADRNLLISKFASSAAHVAGRRLTSAETCTWLAEHFCETLEEMKCLVDRMLVSGVNHVFYHGCVYSPDDAAWPGWLFYASTQMNPRNSVWRDAPALNAYIARCQAVLQSGEPDNDVLLYWPIHDLWHTVGKKPGTGADVVPCSVHGGQWFNDQPIGATARHLWEHGYGFDYVSDRQLSAAKAGSGGIVVPGGTYRAIVVPPTTYMPVATLKGLLALAKEGAPVIFQDRVPQDVPGLADLENRRKELRALLADARPTAAADLDASLARAGAARESVVDTPGLTFLRRRHDEGRHYFLANQGMNRLSGWVALGTPAKSVVVMDPLSGRTGVAEIRRGEQGATKVYIRLEPGHSILLRTFTDRVVEGEAWQWTAPGVAVAELPGPWQVTFLQGGPVLPKPYETAKPESWTAGGDPEAERFAGTAVYRTTFDAPQGGGPWVLDLGRVCHSARVRLNGEDLGTLIMHPYRLTVAQWKPAGNLLEVEVTNLSANRIRDLDRRKAPWRIFHDINLVNIAYRPFDASEWPIMDSGLLGPVRLMRCSDPSQLAVEKERFGALPDGTPIDVYTLRNAGGLEARVMTLGATLLTVRTPDRDGKLDTITLHRDTLEDYLRGHPLLGSVVGRFANRIAGARFTLDGVEYAVTPNAGKHHIHGGGRTEGFQWLVWNARPIEEPGAAGVELSLVNPDGQAGYPGRLEATVTYKVTADNELVMDYTALTDKPTHVNLTNHAYWNLAGADSGEVLGHELTLHADHYLPSDQAKIPTGEIRPVKDTVMDFRQPRAIGSRVEQVEGKCYDHCYVLDKRPGARLSPCARVVEPTSGRVMEVFTTQPGVQLYTGNRQGFCLETQHYPNTPNEPRFPSTVLRPGETFHETTVHRFLTLETQPLP